MAAFPLFSLSRIPLKCVLDQLDHTTILEIAKGSKTAKRCVRRLEMPVKLCCVFMDINTRMSVATAGQKARVYYDNPDCSWSPNEVRWTYKQMEELARRLAECFEVECDVTIDSLLDCVKSIKDLFVWKHGIDCPYIEVHDALMTDAEFEFLFDYSAATHDIRPIGRHLTVGTSRDDIQREESSGLSAQCAPAFASNTSNKKALDVWQPCCGQDLQKAFLKSCALTPTPPRATLPGLASCSVWSSGVEPGDSDDLK
ncbi:unnamed protein product [Caenorhabditis sp. 36 PRJEB53466]|nr:unnamed protein product [Caenorhabditis sp. 36 PRJEB53466]